VEGNKSPEAHAGWSSESLEACRDRACMPGSRQGRAGCTGAFGMFPAGCKFPGRLRIARCQSHSHVLWETKQSQDLWGKHSISSQSKQEGRAVANPSKFTTAFGQSAKHPHSQGSICPFNENGHVMGTGPHAMAWSTGSRYRPVLVPTQKGKTPLVLLTGI